MTHDNIQHQIESLRAEVRAINQMLTGLRYDDVRYVFGKQIRSVLLERCDRYFDQSSSALYGPEDRDEMERISHEVAEMVEALVASIVHEEEERTRSTLDHYSSVWKKDRRLRGWQDLEDFIMGTLDQIGTYLGTSAMMKVQVGPGKGAGRVDMTSSDIDAEAAESVLAPLSNAVRIRTLNILRREKMGLTDLCRRLDMQKGHLQFHLRTLTEAELVILDRKTKLYSISAKGTMALDCIRDMTGKMIRTADM